MKPESNTTVETPPSADGAVESRREGAPRFHIEPATIYSREALALELSGIMTVATFLVLAKPKKICKCGWWGQHLIDGLDAAPALGEDKPAEIVPIIGSIGKARRAASPVRGCPIGLEPLDPKKIT